MLLRVLRPAVAPDDADRRVEELLAALDPAVRDALLHKPADRMLLLRVERELTRCVSERG
jgi:hypothetical protein